LPGQLREVIESDTAIEERAFKNLSCSLKVLRFYVLVWFVLNKLMTTKFVPIYLRECRVGVFALRINERAT